VLFCVIKKSGDIVYYGPVNGPLKLPRLLFLLIALALAAHESYAQSSFTISGSVKDSGGNGIANVTMVLLSDAAGTQIAFTDQNGNYALTYAGGVSHNLRVTPSKPGWIFSPLAVIFVSTSPLFGNIPISFEGTQFPIPVPLPFQMPFLMTQENSLRALALDSATWVAEPFGVANIHNFSTDQRTRLSLFAANVELGAGETSSIITAQAENSTGQIFPLTLEFFGAVPNFPWLKQIVVKLPDEIANSVEVRVSIKVRDTASNKVLVKVKP